MKDLEAAKKGSLMCGSKRPSRETLVTDDEDFVLNQGFVASLRKRETTMEVPTFLRKATKPWYNTFTLLVSWHPGHRTVSCFLRGNIMSGEDLLMTFERQRKKEDRERRKSEKQREKQPKKQAISPISKPKDAKLVGDKFRTAVTMDPDLYIAVTEGDILKFAEAVERGPAERHFGLPAFCVQHSPQKNTVLHIATSFGHDEIVKLICKDLPFLVTEKNSVGDTALHIAARDGNSLLVSLLVDCRENSLGEENVEGNTALHEALLHRHKDVAQDLIDKDRSMSYSVNKEGKSLLYLAAEAGFSELVRLIMTNPIGNYSREAMFENKSPVHAAILARNMDVLKLIWEKDQSSFHLMCEDEGNPLHCAASMGYIEGVNYLLDIFCVAAYQKDKNGCNPIHIASNTGHIKIIQDMLLQCPDSRELLNQQDQNIIHVAAKSGKADAVNYLLKVPELQKLINERDKDGNTPLHLATIYEHPKIVNTLTSDQRVHQNLVNNRGLTALDIAEDYMKTRASFRKKLTWMALRVAGAPRSSLSKISKSKRQNPAHDVSANIENYKDKVNVILLVATLVATVTFAAGFTIPGGYNNSNPDEGMATMLAKTNFHTFVICDTIAMYSSIIVAVTLIWAQLNDTSSILVALKFALPLLGIALSMMSIAFMAGVYLVVSKLHWLAKVVSFMGVTFVITLLTLFIPLCFLASSNYHIFRHISYYPFRLVLFAVGSYTNNNMED